MTRPEPELLEISRMYRDLSGAADQVIDPDELRTEPKTVKAEEAREYGSDIFRMSSLRLFARAWMLAKSAADSGFLLGFRALGDLNEQRNEPKAALEAYRKGASLGDTMYLYHLREMLLNGRGCDRDLPQASKKLKTAARGGILSAEALPVYVCEAMKDEKGMGSGVYN